MLMIVATRCMFGVFFFFKQKTAYEMRSSDWSSDVCSSICRGVGQHPHRGFETVTIVYQGELEHRDSTGSGGKIGPGDVQWMTAASGIIHEEFHSEAFAQIGIASCRERVCQYG